MIGEDLIRRILTRRTSLKPYMYLLLTSISFWSRCSVDIELPLHENQRFVIGADDLLVTGNTLLPLTRYY